MRGGAARAGCGPRSSTLPAALGRRRSPPQVGPGLRAGGTGTGALVAVVSALRCAPRPGYGLAPRSHTFSSGSAVSMRPAHLAAHAHTPLDTSVTIGSRAARARRCLPNIWLSFIRVALFNRFCRDKTVDRASVRVFRYPFLQASVLVSPAGTRRDCAVADHRPPFDTGEDKQMITAETFCI